MKYLIALFLSTTFFCHAQHTFTDISSLARINNEGHNTGVAVGDYDQDGWQDVYVSVRNGANRLYRNLGDGTFSNVAPALGLDYAGDTRVSSWADINNDGHLDLYLGNNLEEDKLFENNGDGTFSDITQAAGISNLEKPHSTLFADINMDGLLDIYVANFQSENKLYLNSGLSVFVDYTTQSGALDMLNNMGAVFFDYDEDGDPDLYLTHDGQPSILYQNDGSGHFTDVSAGSGLNLDGYGMGVDIGDINRDGHMDVYVTNLFENYLFLNNGNGTFTEIGAAAGVDDYGMGWGINFFDFDNDGWVDIHIANDSYFSDYNNVVYRNNGDLTFDKVLTDNPIASDKAAYGSACFDMDRNGLLEVFIANYGTGSVNQNQLFRNDSDPLHFIAFNLVGTASNSLAIGAKISIIDEQGKKHYDEVTAGSGFASQNSMMHHFGLGPAENIHELKIEWPSGLVQQLSNLPADHFYEITEGQDPVVLYENSSIEEEINIQDLRIYPNPVNDVIYIETTGQIQFEKIQILNSRGQVVYAEYDVPANHAIKRSTINTAPGMHIIQLFGAHAYRFPLIME